MKQMESAVNGRRTNSECALRPAFFRAPQPVNSTPVGWQNGGSSLQRTFGNAAVGKMTGAQTADTGLSAKVFSEIVERGMRGPAKNGGKGETGNNGNAASTPQGAGSAPVIQRDVMESGDFDLETAMEFGTSDPGEFFEKVSNDLGAFESMPQVWANKNSPPELIEQMNEEYAARMAFLRTVYKNCDEWILTPESEKSPGLGLIKQLMEQMRDEISPQEAPKDNKAGTALGKTSNVTVDRSMKLSPEQQQAIEVIDKTSLHKLRKEHAHDMIRNPEMIQQGAFGVCGLTSILYAIALATPVKFAEMIRDAWSDAELVEKWMEVYYENGDPRHITIRAEVEYITAQWLVRKSQKGKGSSVQLSQEQLDHWTRRESEKNKKQNYTDVFERQKKFSDSFEIEGWENTLGHFALTAGALSHLLNGIGTGKPSYKIKRNSVEKDLAMVERLKGSTSSVIASVTNTEFYEEGKDVTDNFKREDGGIGGDKPFIGPRTEESVKKKPKLEAQPKYVHWVILKGAKLGNDGFYDLDIWTWGSNYKARVHKDVVYSHIYSLVIANSKLW